MESPKLRLVAFLFAFFLGMFGVHRFYVGKIGSGIVILILSLTVIGTVVSALWVLVDWIMILSGSFKDSKGRLITKWTN